MTLQEIKDQYAREKGYDNWDSLIRNTFDRNYPGPDTRLIDQYYTEANARYTTACCKATLEKAAQNIDHFPEIDMEIIFKESIVIF
jgi:hypothetical protein